MFDTSAIVLAAGMSRRMGAENKLLLPIHGRPMLHHVVTAHLEACDGPVTVVTGHEAEQVEAAIYDLPVDLVYNPKFQQGQKTSVAAGLKAVADAKEILVALGDQPRLTADALNRLCAVHRAHQPSKITIPIKEGQRGNPIVIPGSIRQALLADPRNPGCQSFTRTNPDMVRFVSLNHPAYFQDVDTPEDLAAMKREAAL